jgi:hypothetical protein
LRSERQATSPLLWVADTAEELPPLVWDDFIEAMKRIQVQ